MKRGLISIVLMALVALAGMAQVSRHEVKVGNFSRLALIDNINVNYRCNADSAGLAVLTCTQDIADHIMFSLSSKGQLSIQVVDEYERTGDLPTITSIHRRSRVPRMPETAPCGFMTCPR